MALLNKNPQLYHIVLKSTTRDRYIYDRGSIDHEVEQGDENFDLMFELVVPDENYRQEFSVNSMPKWVRPLYNRIMSAE